jgi:hypothetical protein
MATKIAVITIVLSVLIAGNAFASDSARIEKITDKDAAISYTFNVITMSRERQSSRIFLRKGNILVISSNGKELGSLDLGDKPLKAWFRSYMVILAMGNKGLWILDTSDAGQIKIINKYLPGNMIDGFHIDNNRAYPTSDGKFLAYSALAPSSNNGIDDPYKAETPESIDQEPADVSARPENKEETKVDAKNSKVFVVKGLNSTVNVIDNSTDRSIKNNMKIVVGNNSVVNVNIFNQTAPVASVEDTWCGTSVCEVPLTIKKLDQSSLEMPWEVRSAETEMIFFTTAKTIPKGSSLWEFNWFGMLPSYKYGLSDTVEIGSKWLTPLFFAGIAANEPGISLASLIPFMVHLKWSFIKTENFTAAFNISFPMVEAIASLHGKGISATIASGVAIMPILEEGGTAYVRVGLALDMGESSRLVVEGFKGNSGYGAKSTSFMAGIRMVASSYYVDLGLGVMSTDDSNDSFPFVTLNVGFAGM